MTSAPSAIAIPAVYVVTVPSIITPMLASLGVTLTVKVKYSGAFWVIVNDFENVPSPSTRVPVNVTVPVLDLVEVFFKKRTVNTLTELDNEVAALLRVPVTAAVRFVRF